MDMKKIGLITFFRNNYGSALQCYSTKHFIEGLGYQCEIVEKKYTFFEKLQRKIYYYSHKIFNSKSWGYKSCLMDNSKLRIDSFISQELKPCDYTTEELNAVGNKDDFIGFVTGSDQVWNVNGYIDDMYFLKFALPHKKIGFAVSLGTDKLNIRQKRRIKNKIKDFEAISVREKSTKYELELLLGKSIDLISDPTILLTPEEWKKFSTNGISYEEDYILLHFIDSPNRIALNCLRKYKQKNSKIICFGYKHSELDAFEEIELISGDPVDYVSLISKASCVLTDSYHTTLFSIYFNREFRVFEREYQTKYSQNIRLQHILNLYNLEECYNCDDVGIQSQYDSSKIMQRERLCTADFLKNKIDGIAQKEDAE